MPITSLASAAGSITNTDIVQLSVEAELYGQAVNNVWYAYGNSGAPLSGSEAIDEMNKVAEAMMGTYKEAIMPLLGADLTLLQCRSRKIQTRVTVLVTTPVTGKWIYDIQGINVDPSAGAKVGDGSPSYVAGTVNLITGDAGRHYRGSKRFGGIVEADTEDNKFAPGVFGDWVTAFEGLLAVWGDEVTAAGCDLVWKLCVASNTIAPPTPATSANSFLSLITTPVPQIILGSQVSRKQKRRFA